MKNLMILLFVFLLPGCRKQHVSTVGACWICKLEKKDTAFCTATSIYPKLAGTYSCIKR